MLGAFTGLGIVLSIISIGYLVGRSKLVTHDQLRPTTLLTFYITSPALLFTVLAQAHVTQLLSPTLAVSTITALSIAALYTLISITKHRKPAAETAIGAASSSYINGNNIGLPIAIYMLGDGSYIAGILLLQLLILAPATLTVLDLTTGSPINLRRILISPLRNPIIIASLAGVATSLTNTTLPTLILQPLTIIGGAAIPTMLLSFGISISGQKPLQPGSNPADTLTVVALKTIGAPTLAWVLGNTLIPLTPHELLAATTLAALPTAQNMHNFATTYRRGETLARDAILLTTALCVPAILLIAWALGE